MPTTPRQALEAALLHPDYEDVTELTNVLVDLRYGSKQNLLNKDVYQGFQRALLHRIAAAKFRAASKILAARHPSLRFLVFDALRPQTAQIQFWELVRGTPQQPYFADPLQGSLHSYGFAIDLSLADSRGEELPMGTEFDDLSELAQPQLEDAHLLQGRLSAEHLANRRVLRNTMEEAGFRQLPHEWWHFDALPAQEVRAGFPRCD